MSGPFEVVGDDAPVCVDGVCALPGEPTDSADERPDAD